MRRWIVRSLVVVAVVGGFALGRGLRASAEVPTSKTENKPFICGRSSTLEKLGGWLTGGCDPNKSFTITHYLVYGGTGETFAFCCVEK